MVHHRVSAAEQWERRTTIRSNLASQRMEGHEPDAQALQDCEKRVRGETTIKEIVESYKSRLRTMLAADGPNPHNG